MGRQLTRRELLRQSAGGLLLAGLWPGALNANGSGEESFSFLAVNDIHYLDKGCGDWLRGVFKQMQAHKEKPAFCLLAGDLTEQGTKGQLAAMRDLIKEFELPTYVVIGNHDYETDEDRKAYEEFFPERLNYQFTEMGWQFVGLNTTQGRRARDTTVSADTLTWLDDHLPKLDKKKPLIVFTHFPLGPWTIGRPRNADKVLDRFREHNLQAVFCGHWHGFTERQTRGVSVTTNRCCSFRRTNHDGTKEKGYFLCQAKDGKISRTQVEVPQA
jgi:3',5'-cyclic AMP phosphodiesterase CpdA